ncbi:hypothetical protein [Legionella pneumophila]|uniref:hypothetical protein n=1 Tax=Legionella pneumophila TaxID=446 RepID=UPI0015E88603|nr:hypothetical protein [Legionella pneumophila]
MMNLMYFSSSGVFSTIGGVQRNIKRGGSEEGRRTGREGKKREGREKQEKRQGRN